MSIHPQRYSGVTVSQAFRHTHNVGSARDRNGGGAVPELVGVEVWDAVPLPKFLEIPCRGLGVHGIREAVLSEYPLTDTGSGLILPEAAQDRQRFRSNVNGPCFPVFGGGRVNASLGGILEVPADRDGSGIPVYITPPEAAQFASTRSCIGGKVDVGLSFQRLLSDAGQHTAQLFCGQGFVGVLLLWFVLPGGRAFYLCQRIHGDAVI